MELDVNALQLLEENNADEFGRFPCTDASCTSATCSEVGQSCSVATIW
ncbi:ALQxL family class IV lanthipeptide [Micromonospora sp. NPDC049559]